MKMTKIGVVVACEGEESDAFFERWGEGEKIDLTIYKIVRFRGVAEGKEVIMIISGAGLVDVAGATQYLIDKFQPELIIKVGLVSGATERERVGEVYLVSGAIDASYNISVFGNEPGQHTGSEKIEWMDKELVGRMTTKLEIETRVVATTNYFIKNAGAEKVLGDGMDKGELRELYPEAGVFDMENSAVTRICRRNGVPCLAIAGVSDDYQSGAETYAEMAPIVSREGLVPVVERVIREF